MLCCIFLLGCKQYDDAMDKALSLRQKLMAASMCRFECKITADYGELVYEFLLDCEFDHNGTMKFTVIEPESIADISGEISSQGGLLTFDDTALGFPLMADGYLSPVSAPWIFIKSLRGGYIHACGADVSGVRMILHDSYGESPLQIDVWIEEEIPHHCEILWQGRKILSLDVIDFQCL